MDKHKPFDFHIQADCADLSDIIESIWYARGTVPYRQENIAPTGSAVAILVLGDPIAQMPLGRPELEVQSADGLLIGPHDGPIINRPLGETHAVGIVARPAGCESLFGILPTKLRGGIFLLKEKWPNGIVLRKELEGIEQGGEKTEAVLQFLLQRVGDRTKGLARVSKAIEMMETDPMLRVAEIAAELGISTGHLDREFVRIVGLSPRTLSNIIRMRGFLKELDVLQTANWADLAAAHQWFDQAHFIRNFKRHTGVTPTQYVAAQRAVSEIGDLGNAAGFVPEF